MSDKIDKTLLERTIKNLSVEEKVHLFNVLDDEGKLNENPNYTHIYLTREILEYFYNALDMNEFIRFISGSGYLQLEENKFCRVKGIKDKNGNIVEKNIETFDNFSQVFDEKMGLDELNPTDFSLVDLILDTDCSFGNKKIESALKVIKDNKEEERENEDIRR